MSALEEDMSLPERNNPYNFDEFLAWRKSFDYYSDDPFLQMTVKHFAAGQWEAVDAAARAISPAVSFKWRDLSDAIAVPEKRPYLVNYDGHNHRVDRIVRPAETLQLEREIFSEALFSSMTPPWVRLSKMYLVYQNGEACVACPLVCTEGLVALLDRYSKTPETDSILRHCKEGVNGEFAIGAQYLSEIQGGSDVPANLLEAVEKNGTWRLYGTKFFCSATHADYAVVTAKPKGSDKVAIFIVPSWLPGDKERERRNGYTIDRIKWKMGTSELTTAELTFNGAVAYPAGPLDRGLANVVGIVLTYSRLTVGLSAAASMTRAAREAIAYAKRRKAFDMTIADFPMLKAQLDRLDLYAKRTTAGAFGLYRDFLALPEGLKGGLKTSEPENIRRKRFEIRELIMLQKITASWDATDMLRLAMSVFGGHGVMEDFSSLPRLFRDAAINELWEGPRNVLLTQIHRDLARAAEWYRPEDFVKSILSGADDGVVGSLAGRMKELSARDLVFSGAESERASVEWDAFCHDLFHAYQDSALAEVLAESVS
jgi:alkylation response protein AidB-like acyl-CoA dehydrogenase